MRRRFIALTIAIYLALGLVLGYLWLRAIRSPTPQPFSAPPTSTPTATPTALADIRPSTVPPRRTPRPTVTYAPPSPTSTPTVPAQALSLHDLLWLEDYPAAKAAVRDMLKSAPAEERPGLRLLLAHILAAEGREADALQVLGGLISCRDSATPCPGGNDKGVPDETLLFYARLLSTVGRDDEAIVAYRAYITGEPTPPLAFEAHAGMARIYRRLGQETAALAAYERAAAYAPTEDGALLRLEMAGYLGELERYQEALALYTALLQDGNLSPAQQARALLERGQVYLSLGQAKEAHADWLAAVEVAVGTEGGTRAARPDRAAIPYAYQALILLVAADVDVDDYTRGVVDVEAGAYWPAINVLIPYLDTIPNHFGDAHAYLARALAAVGRTEGAMEQWRVLIDTHPECACWGDAWFALARLYRQTRQDARARSLMRELIRHPRATSALRERGRLYIADQYLGDGNFTAAMREYASLTYAAQTPQVRNRAALLVAVISLPQRPDTAIEAIKHALAFPVHRNWSPVLRYWLGKAYLRAGEQARAEETWRALAAERPQSYYAFRAAEQLQGLGVPIPPWEPSVDARATASSPWQPATTRVEALLTRFALAPPIADLLQRAAAYEVAGMDTRAYATYSTVLARVDDPAALLAIGAYLQNEGYFNLGIRAALRALDISGRSLTEASPEYWRLLYPTPAPGYIRNLADEFHVDPALLYALIRQESHFATRATSVANARGLMQLIPDTARYVARSLNLQVDDEVDLYRPTLNLRLGTYFLAYNLRRFDNNVLAALAGYNAGPGNAAYWLRVFGNEPDRFLELIPVLETRTYLREVLRQWEIYRRLVTTAPP